MMIRNSILSCLKAFIVFSILLFSDLFSQTTVSQPPVLVNGSTLVNPDTAWTTIAGGASATFEWHFAGSERKSNRYAGFSAIFMWVDTTTAGDGQGLRAYARPMIYDQFDSQFEKIVEPNSNDSTNIAQNFNWQTNHDDDSYSLSKALNFLDSDGVFVKVFADSSNAGFKVRPFLKQAIGGR